MKGKNCLQFRLLTWNLFIGQFIYPVGGDGVKEVDKRYRNLASYEYHLIRVHKNLVQHSSNNV